MSSTNNDLLFESVEDADVTLWMIYYKQQIVKNQKKMINLEAQIAERQSAERQKLVISTSSFAFVWKFFTMKIIDATSDQYEEKNYKKWKRYCKQMKNQFTQNNVNHMTQFSNLIKIAYVNTYLKFQSNANKLWNAEIDAHSNKTYIWNEFKTFLKSDIERAITLQQNLLRKYRKHKQDFNQSVKNYNVERVSMLAELELEFRLTDVVKLNDFRDELRLKLRCLLLKEKEILMKIELLDRLKRMKDDQALKKKLKNFKKRKIFFDTDSFESENEKFKIAKTKNKKIKNTNKINSNHESIKFKNIRMYRWFAIKFKKIQIKSNCIECDESNHQIEICTDLKEKIIFVDQTFEQSKN